MRAPDGSVDSSAWTPSGWRADGAASLGVCALWTFAARVAGARAFDAGRPLMAARRSDVPIPPDPLDCEPLDGDDGASGGDVARRPAVGTVLPPERADPLMFTFVQPGLHPWRSPHLHVRQTTCEGARRVPRRASVRGVRCRPAERSLQMTLTATKPHPIYL